MLISAGSWLANINLDLQQNNLITENGAILGGLGDPTGNGGEFYIGGGGGGAGALMASSNSTVPGPGLSNNVNGGGGFGGSYQASGGTGGKGGGGNGALHYSLLVSTGTNALNAIDGDPSITSISNITNGSQFGSMIDLYSGSNSYSDFMSKLPSNWDYRDYFHGKNAKRFTGSGGGGAYRSGSRIATASVSSPYRYNSDGVIGESNGRKDSRYRAEGKAGDGAPGIVILRYKITS